MNSPEFIQKSIPPQLPEQGGIVWVAGGVPINALPAPCSKCVDFLAQMNDAVLINFIQRIREQTGRMGSEGETKT
ncbi:MAG: hypothetical protein HZB43_08140 [candidate division Zixibacteria bacterium]|nr:hypothetical protein [candidate division Zixibacteria bacterium]